jgi:hypothetical protein
VRSQVRLPRVRSGVMDGRKGGLADVATLRPVNPQVRTCPGAPANFRLCATKRLMQRSNNVCVQTPSPSSLDHPIGTGEEGWRVSTPRALAGTLISFGAPLCRHFEICRSLTKSRQRAISPQPQQDGRCYVGRPLANGVLLKSVPQMPFPEPVKEAARDRPSLPPHGSKNLA